MKSVTPLQARVIILPDSQRDSEMKRLEFGAGFCNLFSSAVSIAAAVMEGVKFADVSTNLFCFCVSGSRVCGTYPSVYFPLVGSENGGAEQTCAWKQGAKPRQETTLQNLKFRANRHKEIGTEFQSAWRAGRITLMPLDEPPPPPPPPPLNSRSSGIWRGHSTLKGIKFNWIRAERKDPRGAKRGQQTVSRPAFQPRGTDVE